MKAAPYHLGAGLLLWQLLNPAVAEDQEPSLDMLEFLADFSDPADDQWLDPVMIAGDTPAVPPEESERQEVPDK